MYSKVVTFMCAVGIAAGSYLHKPLAYTAAPVVSYTAAPPVVSYTAAPHVVSYTAAPPAVSYSAAPAVSSVYSSHSGSIDLSPVVNIPILSKSYSSGPVFSKTITPIVTETVSAPAAAVSAYHAGPVVSAYHDAPPVSAYHAAPVVSAYHTIPAAPVVAKSFGPVAYSAYPAVSPYSYPAWKK